MRLAPSLSINARFFDERATTWRVADRREADSCTAALPFLVLSARSVVARLDAPPTV
jgi:hypothetical protein